MAGTAVGLVVRAPGAPAAVPQDMSLRARYKSRQTSSVSS